MAVTAGRARYRREGSVRARSPTRVQDGEGWIRRIATERWSSRVGFLLATVGAAVGLGNIWQFSAVVGQNGGGACLVPSLIAAFVCAVPPLVLELAVGRRLRTDVASAFRSVDRAYTVLGWVVVAGVALVLSYYLVLTGWVPGYLRSWLAGTGDGTTFTAFGWLAVRRRRAARRRE